MYPLHIAQDIIKDFKEAHPRGWVLIVETFYIRDESVEKMFQLDQRMWRAFKDLVKRCDKDVSGQVKNIIDTKALLWLIENNTYFNKFFRYYRHFSELYSDELDYLTFVGVKKEYSQPNLL